MTRVFISYSHSDSDEDLAQQIYVGLKARGIDPWMDRHNIQLGERWEYAIANAIRDSAAVLVLISEGASDSQWVRNELGLATRYGKPIYLIIANDEANVQDTVASLRLRDFQIVDARGAEDAAEETVIKLSDALEKAH